MAIVSVCAAAAWTGCAGVKMNQTGSGGSGGNGGSGGGGPTPPIPGLLSLRIDPPSQTIDLGLDGAGRIAPGSADFHAFGMMEDGSTQDLTAKVLWAKDVGSVVVAGGRVTVIVPGKYTIRARGRGSNGDVEATAELIASFRGSFPANGYDPANTPALDGTPSGSGAQIAYPLDGSLFPSNLGPITVHIVRNGAAPSARLRFEAPGVDVTWYGQCEAGMPGTGCYLTLPVPFTQLFIAASEAGDVKLTARVGGAGVAVSESPPVNVAWSQVGVTGGLYYWSVITPAAVTGYVSPEMPVQPQGTGIMRYDFAKENPLPQLVWTDRGPPPFGTTVNAPQSFVGNVAGSHCIGCHSISNDGKYMALTLGGSSAMDGANFALLDITAKSLLNINPTASTDPSSTPLQNPTDYWKKFRRDGFATESAWGPNNDALASMFQSKIYLSQVTIGAGTATAVRTGLAMPSGVKDQPADQYQSDPFWSQDGKLFAFTSFNTPDVGLYNTTGLNGDMKRTGQIAIATATATGINDDAHVLVPRTANLTSYYPAISNDSKWVVFNASTCGADPDPVKLATDYGNQSCDGYDDSTATLWIVNPAGGNPLRLDRANGQGPLSNSWPRWSPDSGNFRGKRLYWIAFSSRRNYGLQVNTLGAGASAKPQLWFTGIATGDEFASDPSFSPVWLPGQNLIQSAPTGNHVPQWVAFAVPIPQ